MCVGSSLIGLGSVHHHVKKFACGNEDVTAAPPLESNNLQEHMPLKEMK